MSAPHTFQDLVSLSQSLSFSDCIRIIMACLNISYPWLFHCPLLSFSFCLSIIYAFFGWWLEWTSPTRQRYTEKRINPLFQWVCKDYFETWRGNNYLCVCFSFITEGLYSCWCCVFGKLPCQYPGVNPSGLVPGSLDCGE